MTGLERGVEMYEWARALFPMPRSITGEGVRETLRYLQGLNPDLKICGVPSGTQAFDWVVPNEWTVRDALIADESGRRVVDFKQNNLHVVGYSAPVDAWMTRTELEPHLHSLPDQPDAIPYITSYYEPRWGFCISQHERDRMLDARYHVVIDSDLAAGVLNYGELVIPGREDQEILLSANICHPSLANNEISGMVVISALARWLSALPDRRLTYRLLFIPETIGSICYLSRHLDHMKKHVMAGFVVTCAGDDRAFSYVPSRSGATLADRVALRALARRGPAFTKYSYLDRGSDERQFCSPGIDLPVCSLMRSKYGTYPEYHTSLDDLGVISPAGLQGSFDVLRDCLEMLEASVVYRNTVRCEPQLGRRGLYPTLSTLGDYGDGAALLDILAYADGTRDLVDVAGDAGIPVADCTRLLRVLADAGLVEIATAPVAS